MSRNPRIDILRVIGTALVILAHMEVGGAIQNIRTFDVVLLVFLSGYSFMLGKDENFGRYLLKRIKKLLIPTLITITVLFAAAYIGCALLNVTNPFDVRTVLLSYIFHIKGIGYIWIVKIYLLTALVIFPLKKLIAEHAYLLCVISYPAMIILGLIFTAFYGKNDIFDSYIGIVVPYIFVAILGATAESDKNVGRIILGAASVLFLVSLFVNKMVFEPEAFKYPPSIYYMSYGIFVTMILMFIIPEKENRVITWLSRNSFTIYLLHIIVLFGVLMLEDLPGLGFIGKWYIKYVIVLCASVICAYILDRLKRRLLKDK